MTYTPISTVRNLGIQSSAQKRLEDLRLQAEELSIKDRLDAKASRELDAALEDDLYALRNTTKDYAFTDAAGNFNITSIKDKSLKYTPAKKNELLAKYRGRFTKLGVPFNINAFEEAWQKGKVDENRRILSDLNIAKSKGNISDDDFNQALDNEEFRRFYLNLTDANNQAMLTDLGYNPLYKSPEDRWKAVKDRFSLGNIQETAEEGALVAAENPFITGPAVGGVIYAGSKILPRIRSMMGGGAGGAAETVAGDVNIPYSTSQQKVDLKNIDVEIKDVLKSRNEARGALGGLRSSVDKALADAKKISDRYSVDKSNVTEKQKIVDNLKKKQDAANKKAGRTKMTAAQKKARTKANNALNIAKKKFSKTSDEQVANRKSVVSARKAYSDAEKKFKDLEGKADKLSKKRTSIKDKKIPKQRGRVSRFSTRLGRGLLGGQAGAKVAEKLGFEGTGGQIAGGLAGDFTLSKAIQKLGDPKVRAVFKKVLQRVAPSLAARMAGSAALTGSGIGTIVGVAGLGLTSYQLYRAFQENPELRNALGFE